MHINNAGVSQGTKHRLMHSSSCAESPWLNVSMDFIVDPQTQWNKDSVVMVVDRFSKIINFIHCHKMMNTSHISDLYFREVTRRHGMLNTITYTGI